MQVSYYRKVDADLVGLVNRVDRIIKTATNKTLYENAIETKRVLHMFYQRCPFVVVFKENDLSDRDCEKWRNGVVAGRSNCIIYDDGFGEPLRCMFLSTQRDQVKFINYLKGEMIS